MADKPEKSNKLKARLPRGLADRTPGEIAATRVMIEKIRAVYELYGFEPGETPAIEYTDALGKFLPDQDRPNEGVFSFQDDDEQWLSLRYDLTAPLARYVAENFDTLPKPYRSYRVGQVFRNEKPGPGRFRQFMQFDADTVGSASPAADAEMCMMAADTMEALGLKGHYVVKVNNRKILDGALESIGLTGEANAGRRLTVLRAIDKLDRLRIDGVVDLLGKERKDASGDVTKGAGLEYEQIALLLNLFTGSPVDNDAFFREGQSQPQPTLMIPSDNWRETRLPPLSNEAVLKDMGAAFASNYTFNEGLNELRQITDLVAAGGYRLDRIRIDPSVVRGIEYYTGPVFEVDLTFPITTDDGKPVRFGSVGAGGRYDGLISRFRGEPVPATGFSIGVSRLLAALQHLGKIESKAEHGPVVVTVFDKERIADYQQMVRALRDVGIRAELYLGGSGFNAQMRYADKRKSPCIVIQGSNEKHHPRGPKIIVKDLILGAELAKLEKDRSEYIQKQKEAQKIVSERSLRKTVREVLARHTLGLDAGQADVKPKPKSTKKKKKIAGKRAKTATAGTTGVRKPKRKSAQKGSSRKKK